MSIVEETNHGLYVWELDDGRWIKDEDGNVLSMPSVKGDAYKLGIFKRYAHDVLRDMGAEPNGKAVFLVGHRQISDAEFEEQKLRQEMGLTPDKFDVGAAMAELEYKKRFEK